ncbi:uncharacterized protein LOC132181784 [Corylus avellana]|uniref:uncharacterized protein LOC132181784 n=1 Tax=Corylus avellana TaxID=13451 RepID=UPI00286A522B|nr:uncharacterized protein LOC132181784 [Corylus avellana]
MSQPTAPVERIGCSMRDFTDQQFRTFNGTQGHTVVEAWISDIQLLHDTLKCTNEEKLTYTVLRLTGEALKWWKSQVELIGLGVVITWERFVEEFNRQYFPRSQKQLRAIEFQNLVQDRTFENGLNSRIKERVVCHEIKNYARLVNVSSLAERAIGETSAAYEHRKRSMPQASYPSKRFVVGTGSKPVDHQNFSPPVGSQKVACPKCGRMHFGDCRSESTGYFRCGQKGHFKKDCPMNTTGEAGAQRNDFQQRRPAQARVYTLNPVDDDENDEANKDIVTGTISLFGTLACTLFDSRATHSFISALYTKIYHINTRPFGQDWSVQTPG